MEALAARENWLTPLKWRIDDSARVVWDADISVPAGNRPISLIYPIIFLSPLPSCSRAATTRAGRSTSTVREANSVLSTVRTTGIRTFRART